MSDPALWAETATEVAKREGLPLVVLGGADHQAGDAALLANLLRMGGEQFLHVDSMDYLPRAVYLIAVDEDFSDYRFPLGASVIDPFGTVAEQAVARVYTLTMHEIASIRPDLADDQDENQLLLDI